MGAPKVCKCDDGSGATMEARSARFAPSGPLALYPAAFGLDFLFAPEPEGPKELRADGVAVVKIIGPLDHRKSWWCSSYEQIREDFDAALALKPKCVLLKIDSPGGLVAGCFELAAHMREQCAKANTPLYAYAEGMCASAAYALACAAEKIGASSTSMVGSIGVIDALVDATANDAAWGVRWKLVTSGARKADGNPHQPITDGAEGAMQSRVNDLASLFYDHVAAARGTNADAIRGLNADIFVGSRAMSLGLLDTLSDPSLQIVESNATKTSSEENGDMSKPQGAKAEDEKDDEKVDPPADDKKESKKAKADDSDYMRKLRKMAEDGDEDAKKMLGKLEADDAEEEDEADDEEAKSKAKALLASDVEKLVANALRAEHEGAERVALLAKRPDLDAPTKALLATAPIEKVRAAVEGPDAIPRRVASRAASAQPGVLPQALRPRTVPVAPGAPAPQPSGAPDMITEMHMMRRPAMTEADVARAAHMDRLFGREMTVPGVRVHRAAGGRITKTEFGVDVPVAEAGYADKSRRLYRGMTGERS